MLETCQNARTKTIKNNFVNCNKTEKRKRKK